MQLKQLLLRLSCSLLLLLSMQSGFSQNRAVTGTVKDDKGNPLAGASVTAKDAETGVSTDKSGTFTLIVNPSVKTIVVSYVGMEPTETDIPANNNVINIVMKQFIKSQDEVVVVAYGTQKKISVSGSVATVGGSALRQSPATDITNSLAGRLPGLVAVQRGGEPGQDGASLAIRGVSTTGDNSPLVIVDGIPGRTLSQINPNDVENISILKDGAAAAYGSRSANGVILVTTRRGSSGKTEFGYNGSYGWQIPTRLPNFVGSYDFARLKNEANANDALRNGSSPPVPQFSADALQKYKDGTNRDLYPDTHWFQEAIRPSSPQTQHTITMRGGTKQARFFASGGYLNQDGAWYGNATNYKRYNLTSNVDFTINNNFTGSLDVQGRQENKNYPGTNTSDIFAALVRTPPVFAGRYSNGLLAGALDNSGNNPLITSTSASGLNQQQNNILQTRLTLKHKLDFITKGLTAEGVGSFDKNYQHNKRWVTPYQYNVLDASTNLFTAKSTSGLPSLTESYADGRSTYARFSISYQRGFGKHDISAIVLSELEDYFTSGLSGARSNYAVSLPYLSLGNVDANLTNSGSSREYGRLGYFGRVNYAYDNRYLLEIATRIDKSNNFPKGKNTGVFPAISAGWIVTNETWFHSKIINTFKLRGSWSLRGNDLLQAGDLVNKISRFPYLATYAFNPSGYTLAGNPASTFTPGDEANPNITWEKAATLNVGFDMVLFSNKLRWTTDVFSKKTKDILGRRNLTVPDYYGIQIPTENLNKVTTGGFETDLQYNGTAGKVTWFAGGNLSYAKDRVDFIDEPSTIPEWQKRTGKRIGADLYYDAIGLFQSKDDITKSAKQTNVVPGDIKYRDVDGDGVITGNDRVVINNTQNPTITYGLRFGAGWKGFDVSVLLQGAANTNLYLQQDAAWPFFNSGNVLQSYADDYWRTDNMGAKYPAIFNGTDGINNTIQSTFWLKNANYLRLKNIELGYNFPVPLMKKLHLTTARFYINGLNLLTFDKIKTFDPEYPSGRGWTYPQQKIINVGFNIGF